MGHATHISHLTVTETSIQHTSDTLFHISISVYPILNANNCIKKSNSIGVALHSNLGTFLFKTTVKNTLK